LDASVGIANVIYNEAIENKKCNMVEFKEKSVMYFVENQVTVVPTNLPKAHEIKKCEGSFLCSYCALFLIWTQTQCKGNVCNIALCMVGLHGCKLYFIVSRF
jgi:hypothetical protein